MGGQNMLSGLLTQVRQHVTSGISFGLDLKNPTTTPTQSGNSKGILNEKLTVDAWPKELSA